MPSKRRVSREGVATTVLWGVAVCVVGVLSWILSDIFLRGTAHLSGSFLIAAPQDAGRSGGIGPIIVSTFLILAVTLGVSIPLSLGTALSLTENARRNSGLARVVRRCLDILAAVPSIVFGLFGNALFCVALGMGYSILSGGLTLACMVLPILIRTTEHAILSVPNQHRYAAAALGLSETSTLFRVVLPSAAPAMAAGLVLSIGRALAETAALIFTSGYVSRMPESVMDSGRSLSVHIYDSFRSAAELRRCVGMIFQKPNPFPMSIARNIQLALREHGEKNKANLAQITQSVLEDVGLWAEVKDRLSDSALTLSGGQQQRLCIARALALEPKILLMDEPCSALDPIASAKVESLINRLRGRYTIVIVTHNLAQARRISDQTVVFWVRIDAGEIIEMGATDRVFAKPKDATVAAYLAGKQG